jgi:hypothetical protein
LSHQVAVIRFEAIRAKVLPKGRFGAKAPERPPAEIAVRLMSKFPDEASRLTAKMNRDRLARTEREAIMEEEAKKAVAIRNNMARLRELRLAKEAQEVGTEIPANNEPKKAKPKGRFSRR